MRLSHLGDVVHALPVFHAGFGVPYDWQHKIPSHYPYRNPVGSGPKAIVDASVAALRAKIAEIGADRVHVEGGERGFAALLRRNKHGHPLLPHSGDMPSQAADVLASASRNVSSSTRSIASPTKA